MSSYDRWYDAKYGKDRAWHRRTKVQVMAGNRTHIVTAVGLDPDDGIDSPHLPPLVRDTARHFNVRELCADKGYSSVENHDVVAAVGGHPFIPFKSTATGASGGLWEQCYHFLQVHREEFLKHYHRRSNVESVFSMVKRLLAAHLMSRTPIAMWHEVVVKFLCHNILVLIHEQEELGIIPDFAAEPLAPAARPDDPDDYPVILKMPGVA